MTAPPEATTPNLASHSGEILLVDDSATSRTLLETILQRQGYRVRIAQNGEEALTIVRALPPDLILLDLILPGLDGFRVTRRLRRDPNLPYIPIILITTIGDTESKVRALEAGADDFVVKPPEEAELLARVAALLRLKRSQQDLVVEKGKVDLLYQISRELSAELDLDTLLTRILGMTIAAAHASRGSIILLGKDREALRHISIHGDTVVDIADEVWARIVRDGLAGWVIRYREGTIASDTQQDPRWLFVEGAQNTTRAAVAVPLLYAGQVSGVLTLTHDEPGRFTPADLDLVVSIASQGAAAAEKARLFQERGRRITELAILNEIGRALSSALDLGRLVELVYEQVSRLFDTTSFFIASYDESRDEWETILDLDRGVRTAPIRHKLGAGLTGHIIRHRSPLIFGTRAELEAFLAHEGIPPIGVASQSWLGVPLIAADKVIGAMAVQDYVQENRYDEQDLALFSTIAAQAAVAIENARLYTETERERGKMAAVLAGTTDAVLVTDPAGKVLLCNPAAERAFGVGAQDAVGRPLASSCANQRLIDLFQNVIEGTPPYVAEILLPSERTLYASVSQVEGVGYVAVMQDITHLKRLDQMKSDFVSTVSHDLRNPLSIIHGYAELLLESPDAEQQRDFAGRIRVVSKQMADLVEDLLNLGKIEAGVEIKRVPFPLEKVIAEALEGASFQAQLRKIALHSEIAGPLPEVLGDPLRLRQVLDNLLSNGLKYTPVGGEVTIRARHGGGSVKVEVHDTGLGIPREAQPRLFAKFYRVPSPQLDSIPGTGLGLAIVKAIVEQHGGQVWVESDTGKGSTFGFSLPIGSTEE